MPQGHPREHAPVGPCATIVTKYLTPATAPWSNSIPLSLWTDRTQ